MTRRSENSGLIDLDALMREAETIEAAARAAATSSPAIHPPPDTKPSPVAHDSLEAVVTDPTPRPAPSAKPRRAPPPVTIVAPESANEEVSRRPLRAALAIALVTAAAAVMLVRTQQTTTSVGPAVAHAAPPATTVATSATAGASADTATGLRAGDLPAAATATTAVAAAPPAPRPKAPAAPASVATLTETALPEQPSSAAGALGDAMRGAVEPREEVAKAEAPAGTAAAQLHPSPGAVVGALGSVLPAARACLAPDDAVRSGLVVFGSDGKVQRVELGGTKPEDECVRAALGKAKVAPFVEDSFATRVTVRP